MTEKQEVSAIPATQMGGLAGKKELLFPKKIEVEI
jgi:hypothetical protein